MYFFNKPNSTLKQRFISYNAPTNISLNNYTDVVFIQLDSGNFECHGNFTSINSFANNIVEQQTTAPFILTDEFNQPLQVESLPKTTLEETDYRRWASYGDRDFNEPSTRVKSEEFQ